MSEVWVVFADGYEHGEIESIHASREGALAALNVKAVEQEERMAGMRDHIGKHYPRELGTWVFKWHGDAHFEAPEGHDRWRVVRWEIQP